MKILVVSGIDALASSNNRLHHFLKMMTKRHQVVLLSVRDNWKRGQTDQKVFLGENLAVMGSLAVVPYHPTISSAMRQELFAWKNPIAVLGLEKIQSFDRVYIYNALLSGLSFAKLAKKHNKKIIIDLADDLVAMVRASQQLLLPLRIVGSWAARYAIQKQARIADRIILSAQTLAKILPPITQKKIVLLRNGVSIQAFTGITTSSNRGTLSLGYVGVLREWVNFKPLLQAMTHPTAYDVTLRIIGNEGRLKELQDEVMKYGLTNRVTFIGAVPYSKLPVVMKEFNVGVIPFSIDDITAGALPLKLYEYAAAGKKIITTPLPEVKAVAKDEVLYATSENEFLEAFNSLRKQSIHTVNYNFLTGADWEEISERFLKNVENI